MRLKKATKNRFNMYGKKVGETDDELLNRLFDELDRLRGTKK